MLFKREIFYYQEINPAIILWKEIIIGKETQSSDNFGFKSV